MLSLVGKVSAQMITVSQPAEMRITDVGTIVSGAIGTVFIIAGIIIFAFIVFGGILMITASGDKAQTERGQQAVSGAMIGFAIIASAYAIMLLLEYVFGYTILGGVQLPVFY
jgi:hypothetical protein